MVKESCERGIEEERETREGLPPLGVEVLIL